MKENECNGLEWRSNGGRNAAKKMPEQCKRTRALWREKKNESENVWLG